KSPLLTSSGPRGRWLRPSRIKVEPGKAERPARSSRLGCLLCKKLPMHARHVAHVTADPLVRSLVQVFQCPPRVSGGVIVQAEIEMSIERAILEFGASWIPFPDGGENFLRPGPSGEQVVDRHQRHAPVLADFQERAPGLLRPEDMSVAKVVPD